MTKEAFPLSDFTETDFKLIWAMWRVSLIAFPSFDTFRNMSRRNLLDHQKYYAFLSSNISLNQLTTHRKSVI